MSPGSHFIFSWLGAAKLLNNRRERALVTLSGIAPDLDGIGLIVDKIMGTTNYYFQYHHYLGHSIFAAFIFASLATLFAKSQKFTVFMLSIALVHMHILFDVIGSRGPDGYQWPIYYLYPLNKEFTLTWQGQWPLNGWQNHLISLILLIAFVYVAKAKQITFLEVFSRKLNEEVFKMYKRYFVKRT